MNDYNAAELSDKKAGAYVLKPIDYRIGSVVAYQKVLRNILRELKKATKNMILPAYKNGAFDAVAVRDEDDEDEVNAAELAAVAIAGAGVAALFQQLRELAARLTDNAMTQVSKIFSSENTRHTKKFISRISQSLGVDVSSVVRPSDNKSLLQTYVNRNANLITSMTNDAIKQIEEEVYKAKLQNKSAEELSASIQQRFKALRKSRADLIARDQLAKINADLSMSRIKQSGAKSYQWDYRHGIPRQTRREHHVARHRKIFPVGEPSGDEPGMAINCQCRARAVIEIKND